MQRNAPHSADGAKRYWLLVLSFLLVSTLLASRNGAESAVGPRFARYSGVVVRPDANPFENTTGKKPATPGKQPWMASLQLAGAPPAYGLTPADLHFCGGALIAPQWVMTAAHCVTPEQEVSVAFDVVLGLHDLQRSGGERIAVAQIYVHKDTLAPHPAGGQYMDVALLRLARPATVGRPIALQAPDRAALSAPGVTARVTGWGVLNSEASSSPAVLHELYQPIVTQAQCRAGMENLAGAITDDMICAGTVQQFRSSCFGDSGGPLTVPDGRGGELLAGIVSFGPGGCGLSAGEFTVYHRVTYSHQWARAIMNGGMPAGTLLVEQEMFPWDDFAWLFLDD